MDRQEATARHRPRPSHPIYRAKAGAEVSTHVDPTRAFAAGDILVLLGASARMADAKDLLRQPGG